MNLMIPNSIPNSIPKLIKDILVSLYTNVGFYNVSYRFVISSLNALINISYILS